MQMIQPALVTRASSDAFALLAVISDPKSAAASLKALNEEATKIERLNAESNAALRKSEEKEREVARRESELEAKEIAFAKQTQAAGAEFERRVAEMARIEELSRRRVAENEERSKEVVRVAYAKEQELVGKTMEANDRLRELRGAQKEAELRVAGAKRALDELRSSLTPKGA